MTLRTRLHPAARRRLRRLGLSESALPELAAPWQSLVDDLARHCGELEQSRADILEAQRLAGLQSWTFDVAREHFEACAALVATLGIDRARWPTSFEDILAFVADDDRDAARRALDVVLAAPTRLSEELRLRCADGEPRWFACSIASHAGTDGRVRRIRAAMFDVTSRRTAESRVQRLAYHDELTGLPNRARFLEHLVAAQTQARARGSRFALLFLDLDGFKEINDSLGHDAGDDLLRQVARRIRSCIREADRLARFGGDEFLVLIDPIRRRDDVEVVTRKILHTVSQPLQVRELTASVSASIGVAVFPEDGDDPQRLLKNADAAMYEAKQSGRNTLRFYTPALNASLLERLALVGELRGAVGRGEIDIDMQPICDGRDGRIVAVEALARWSHPRRGRVLPAAFVPLAEETGEIAAIGRAMLTRACEQVVAWLRAGIDVPCLSVNVSPVQIATTGFVADLRRILATTGLPAHRLQIELTEGTVMDDPQHAAAVLHDLAGLGVGIALDDFGTGHSSLAYLREFPIGCIKIDRSFVVGLDQPGRNEAIIRAIIAIADSLRATVVAEGVENERQREALLALGCRSMQGYLFSRPLPPAAIEPRLPAAGAAPRRADAATDEAAAGR